MTVLCAVTQRLLYAVATCLVVLAIGSASQADDVSTEFGKPLTIRSIDFAFDGGSIVAEMAGSPDEMLYVCIVHPESPAAQRYGGPAKFLISSGKRFSDRRTRILPPTDISDLVSALAKSEARNSDLHLGFAGVLLARAHGQSLSVWDAEAVEAIEQGQWLRLLTPVNEHDEAVAEDPFDF